MPFSGFVDSEQLSFLTRALDAYCNAHHIRDPKGRDEAAVQVMLVYTHGAATYEEVLAALGVAQASSRTVATEASTLASQAK